MVGTDWLKVYNSNLGTGYPPLTREEFVRWLLESFEDNREIMQFRWSGLAHVCNDWSFASHVYSYGWDFSEDTKKARQILTHMCLTPKGAFKAEDWL